MSEIMNDPELQGLAQNFASDMRNGKNGDGAAANDRQDNASEDP